MKYGEALQALRERKGFTLPYVAQRSGLKAARVERIEKDEVRIRLTDAMALLEAIGASMADYQALLDPLTGPDRKVLPRAPLPH
jgi:transcriptional regulator with XRE-family HTH domain